MSPALGLLLCLTGAGSAPHPVDFDTQIMPVLTKAGCNSGACHGAAVGRGGFALSLYGSDPAADFAAITQQWNGRRINVAHPARSLVLRKPTGDIDHEGDRRFARDSESARLIRRWITQGASRTKRRSLARVDVTPAESIVSSKGETIALRVTAHFDGGTQSEVTRWAVVTVEDPAALQVDSDGRLEVQRPGRHLAIVRYLDRVLPIHVTLPYSELRHPVSEQATANKIDEFVVARLQELGLPQSGPADDATFLRRITLHLAGRLPTSRQVAQFLADSTASKRSKLVEQLLSSKEFIDYWTYELSKLLRIRPVGNDMAAAETFRDWVRAQLAANRPFDAIARDMLVAQGDSHAVGPVSFHRVVSGPREQAEFVSELLMGVRLRCANCHDHPLDRWTQDDYHGLAAIFARLQRGQVVSLAERGEVSHPKTQEAAVPKIPGVRFLAVDGDSRDEFADWLTSDENAYFSSAIVNRLWKHMLGRGLVEPVDDMRATNPGTHPELLEWLADDFVRHGYDLRHTLRTIAQSATYQRSSQATTHNASDDRYYSHFLRSQLSAEVLADALTDVTGVPLRYGDLPAGTRAVSLLDPRTPSASLDILGRCSREESCEATPLAGGVAVKLHLLNGVFINDALSDPAGRLHQRLQETSADESLIQEFIVRTLGRHPDQDEQRFWVQEFAAADDRQEVAEDFLWSLLTSRDFRTNH